MPTFWSVYVAGKRDPAIETQLWAVQKSRGWTLAQLLDCHLSCTLLTPGQFLLGLISFLWASFLYKDSNVVRVPFSLAVQESGANPHQLRHALSEVVSWPIVTHSRKQRYCSGLIPRLIGELIELNILVDRVTTMFEEDKFQLRLGLFPSCQTS